MGWFNRKPTQEKYIKSVVKVATNFYLDTLAEDGVRMNFKFDLQDSKYRYLIFCLSTTLSAVLAYDEKKKIQPEELFKGCIHFTTWAASENPNEYFIEGANTEDLVANTTNFFQNFFQNWSRWPALEKENKNDEIINLICSMIHFTESDEPMGIEDIKRLSELALEIDCKLPTMNSAVEKLAKQ